MGRAYDNRKARLIRYVALLSDQIDAAARYGRFCECRGSVRVVRSCLALLTCSLPSTGRDLSHGILSDFAEKPQVLRLRLAPRTRQTPLRMTTLVGISTEPSCLIYAFSASAKDLRPALMFCADFSCLKAAAPSDSRADSGSDADAVRPAPRKTMSRDWTKTGEGRATHSCGNLMEIEMVGHSTTKVYLGAAKVCGSMSWLNSTLVYVMTTS